MIAEAVVPFTDVEVEEARMWLSRLASDWRGEVPTRIHEGGHDQHFGLGSSPPFAPEFIGYIGHLECKREDCHECADRRHKPVVYSELDGYRRPGGERTRTTRAFRKLRRAAPLEYDVLWMAVMHGHSLDDIVTKLNDRAITKGYEDRYDLSIVAVLALAGIDKISRWW